ncbi:MAG: zinc-dependent alcohol dehydrogenase family protein [Pseudotabrizicola sp.]|uniref:zinc-dependent alcohol dehydrogenase family protein n=1 Tax=Pseudotabrizicola sp. TaxID=2939647 RepID=UPI002715BB76|nr:zinc-dependent alcohol dehydrogenase family protein [Pseudotabrizicola sp.]MDO8882393.1 zinc-dependent alcohol dehydrogenase family protein [Pseudotabrizicola sp.]MDP2082605.1 zinc-dependent alcohol dehydrogenase family protein [Pseudotabrizicola sp.]MDZ7573501.1 zinc-dependent alcohol dehydrogenase family protein [Pseudotabrizicola sp.]
MQAVRLFGVGDLRLTQVAEPQPNPGELVVRVEASGICGTDRHLFLGEFPSTPPVTLGHEFSGIVTAVGDGVDLALGTRVTCDPNIPCLTCPQCLRGRVNLCPNNRPTGVGRDGGFAPFALMPAHNAIALPAGLHPHHGAFCEPLACTLHGLDRAALRPGERCMILGGGVIGLLALQLARSAGAEVMMLTRSRAKQDLALSLGATHVAATPAQALAIWPFGADAVIECAGVADTVQAAPALTATGGRIVILGVLAKGVTVAIEPFDLLFREIQMLYSFLNPFTHARAAQMIASGAVSVAPLISRVLTLSEAVTAITHAAPAGDVRAIVVPQ